MVRHLVFLLSLCVLLANCQKENSGGGDLNNSDSGDFSDSGVSSSEDFVDPSEAIGNISSALDSYPTENSEQADAIDSAQSALNSFGNAYDNLGNADSASEFQQFVAQLVQARQKAEAVAKLLEEAQLYALAKMFWELSAKLDVMRFYNSSTKKHLYTISKTDALGASTLGGYKFEGIIFRTYYKAREGCNTPLFRCQNKAGNGDRFLTNDSKCEGNQTEGLIGYVCQAQKPEAWSQIQRLYSKKAVDHVITTNAEEVKKLKKKGYKLEGPLGYAPN